MGLAAALALALAATLLFGGSVASPEPVRRYSIPLLRDELTFSFALSPDGRYIAVESTVDPLSTTQVYLQALDSWEMRPVPGTEGGGNPFWSPDSRYIAFFAREKLWRVPLTGGPAEELADVPGVFGARGAWSQEGVIIVAGSSKYDPGPLRAVPATGGELTPLTTTEPAERHLYPQVLPDGRHFVYTSTGGARPGIYVASLDERAGERLLADVSSAQVATDQDGSSRVLFVRNGSLTAVPFDLEHVVVSGEPVVLVEQIVTAVDDGFFPLSVATDGTLVYAGGSFRESASRFAWVDRSGAVVGEEGPQGPAAPVALAPDGASMVMARREPGQWMSDLWRRDLARGSETRLTFDTRADVASNVVWSPDGRRIMFSTAPAFDLFSMDPRSTAAPEPFFTSDRPKYPSDWSQDGRYVVYTELGDETVADVWYLRVEADSGTGAFRVVESVPFLQTPYLENGGRLSPDAQWIAYSSHESGESEVYVRPFPSGEGQWKVSDGTARQARWSADGRELYYVTGQASRLALMRVPIVRRRSASPDDRAVFEAGTPEPLFTLPINSFHPATGTTFYAPSADGQRFLVNFIDLTEDPALRVVTNWRAAFGLVPQP
jgi:Tol biopolymer transport system component